jgi:hypothetical protein
MRGTQTRRVRWPSSASRRSRAIPRHLALRVLLEYQAGNFETGRAEIARLKEAAASVPPPGPIAEHVVLAGAIPVVARIANTDEGLDLARDTAKRVLALSRLTPIALRYVSSGLAMIAVHSGDTDAAEKLYGTLDRQGAPPASRWGSASTGCWDSSRRRSGGPTPLLISARLGCQERARPRSSQPRSRTPAIVLLTLLHVADERRAVPPKSSYCPA